MKQNIEKAFLEQDKRDIFIGQQKALEYVFSKIDLSKIGFVGGVADYINLRKYYTMPVNDLDIIYEDRNDLAQIAKELELIQHKTKFYHFSENKVLVAEFEVDQKMVHMDFYKRNFLDFRLKQSPLLGQMVWHVPFKEMQLFHNQELPKFTSEAIGIDYEWKRLYKHSRKASLYNNISYLKEKKLMETPQNNNHE